MALAAGNNSISAAQAAIPVCGIMRRALLFAKAKHIGHRIKAGILPLPPARRGKRAAGEDHAVFGPVAKFNTLKWARKRNDMITHHRSTT